MSQLNKEKLNMQKQMTCLNVERSKMEKDINQLLEAHKHLQIQIESNRTGKGELEAATEKKMPSCDTEMTETNNTCGPPTTNLEKMDHDVKRSAEGDTVNSASKKTTSPTDGEEIEGIFENTKVHQKGRQI